MARWLQRAPCAQVVEYGPQYPGYFRAGITVEGSYIPICFYWDNFGGFRMLLDGQGRLCEGHVFVLTRCPPPLTHAAVSAGTCPQPNSSPSCSKGWLSGTVTQVWVASLQPSQLE